MRKIYTQLLRWWGRLLELWNHSKRSAFQAYVSQRTVEGVNFSFFVATPEANNWYITGPGSTPQRKDLAFWKQHLVTKGATVIDCGSFQGFTTLFLSKLVGPQGRVISFEILRENAQIVAKNLEINHIENVQLENVGIGGSSQTVKVVNRPNAAIISAKSNWLTRIQTWVYGTRSNQVVSLDDYCSLHGLQPEMLKIDVEGYEIEVLRGARTILNHRPCLAIEIHPDLIKRRQQNVQEIFEWVHEAHYQRWIQWTEESEPVIYDGRAIQDRVQLFAIPIKG
jgi:FkbM family methyltransferase